MYRMLYDFTLNIIFSVYLSPDNSQTTQIVSKYLYGCKGFFFLLFKKTWFKKIHFFYFEIIIFILFYLFVHLSACLSCMWWGQNTGIGSLLLSCWSPGLNSDYWAWHQSCLPTEPSYWPYNVFWSYQLSNSLFNSCKNLTTTALPTSYYLSVAHWVQSVLTLWVYVTQSIGAWTS